MNMDGFAPGKLAIIVSLPRGLDAAVRIETVRRLRETAILSPGFAGFRPELGGDTLVVCAFTDREALDGWLGRAGAGSEGGTTVPLTVHIGRLETRQAWMPAPDMALDWQI